MKYLILIVVIVFPVEWLTGCLGTTPSRVLIEYRRSGGFAGIDDHLVIYVNGQATLTRRTEHYEFVVGPEEMNQLQTLFESVEFSKLRREYSPPRKGSDLIEYLVTYEGYTVRAMDTVVPESLHPILELLNQITETVEKKL